MKDYLIFVAKCGFVGVVIGTAFAIMSLEKRIERLEDRSSKLVDLIDSHHENDIKFAEVHARLTAQQSSNLWFAYQLVKADTNSTSITISTWTNLPNTGIRAKEDKP